MRHTRFDEAIIGDGRWTWSIDGRNILRGRVEVVMPMRLISIMRLRTVARADLSTYREIGAPNPAVSLGCTESITRGALPASGDTCSVDGLGRSGSALT